MKKLIIAFASIALFAPSFVNAQEIIDEEPYFYQNVLSLSPFHFFDNTFYLSYERMHMNDQSSVLNLGLTLLESSGESKRGIALEFQQRFYLSTTTSSLSSTTFRGIYVGPYIKYRDLAASSTFFGYDEFNNYVEMTEDQSVSNFGLGAIIGSRIAKYNRFYLDFYVGGGVQAANGENTDGIDGIFQAGYTGVTPHGGFMMGISF